MTRMEICLEDLDGVSEVVAAGAERIELCSDLTEGGITPSIGTVAVALRLAGDRLRAMSGAELHQPTFGIQALIRQRPADFVYSTAEIDAMAHDIRAMRELPRPEGVVLGFVVGALTSDQEIDLRATGRLVAAAGPHPVTFHKAFDEITDQAQALEQLIGLGVRRVLTSGGSATALEGAAQLSVLARQAGDRVTILAAGGIRPHNAADVVAATGAREIHLRAPDEQEVERHATSPAVVRSVAAIQGGVQA